MPQLLYSKKRVSFGQCTTGFVNKAKVEAPIDGCVRPTLKHAVQKYANAKREEDRSCRHRDKTMLSRDLTRYLGPLCVCAIC